MPTRAMHTLQFTTLGLIAIVVMPVTAYLPVHKRSSSAVNMGTLQDLDSFFHQMGFEPNTTWKEIEELEIHDWNTIALEDMERTTATGSAFSPEIVGLAARQDETCSALTGFEYILCANMPSRAAWWTAGGALAIWYAPEVIIRWTDAIAHVIRTARSLREVKSGGELGGGLGRRNAVSGQAKQYRFSVPAGVDAFSAQSVDDGSAMELLNDFIYEEDTGIMHYQGTKASLSAGGQPSSRGIASKRQTSDYTIVIQATALSSASTTASQSCVANVIKWHINRATESDRFRCVPIDNRGSWKAALHININKGRDNNGEYGECCDF